MNEINGKKFISDKEASHRYGKSVSWFQKKRLKKNMCKKKYPPFMKIEKTGNVYYSVEELDKWFEENIFYYK